MAEERLGLADGDPDGVRRRVLAAWEDFLALAGQVDGAAASRLPGWRAHDVLTHLGTWDDGGPLERILASARVGAAGRPADPDRENAAVVAAHRDASPTEVLAALVRARDDVAAFFDSPDPVALGLSPTLSILGPLPVLCVVHAVCYELAVHAGDLRPAGAAEPPPRLLSAGLAALVDVTGALAARQGIPVTVMAAAPEGAWRFTSDSGGWTTAPGEGALAGPAILGSAADILDVSAGRAAAPALLLSRRLRVHDLPGFLVLAPLVEVVPGLPGGGPLRAAARTLGTAAGLLGRLPGLRRP